ncbi:MAG: transcriptional regulator, partial [Candidatus Solibacter sp.]|nr:transcriptional regulator [Candidatus Solibacter sp.]
MPLPAIEGYEFGPYRIDTGERLLHCGDELISLPPKVAGTLLVLVRSAGRMVDKAELMKAVWPDTFVEEGALTRNISLLRKALGDTGDEAAYIETIPKRGYRFVAPVRTVAVEPAGAAVEFRSAHPVETGNGDHGGTAVPQRSSWRSQAKWIVLAGILLLAGIAAVARFILGDPGASPVPPVTVAASALAVLPFRIVEKDASRDYFA